MHSEKKIKGKTSLTGYLPRFKEGDKVVLKAIRSMHKGRYHARFHGTVGSVIRVLGRNYEVSINDKAKSKTVIVNSVHLKKA